ncbi:MAG: DNA polymerase I [Planctomycetes bacterium GWF2_50_10]|nr:MAG: DNA polymerase I [Planctomycetes bacterium GWF2_50_10]
MSKKLYIIDGHAHIYAAYYAPMKARLTSPTGEPTKATYIFTTTVLSLLKTNPDMVVMAMDSRSSFRTELYKEYKAHRPPMPDDLPPQIARINEIVAAMNIPILRIEGYEADDIIGTVARKAAADGFDVFICSKDKDMLQLLCDRVSMYDISSAAVFDQAKMLETKGVRPDQFIDVLSLMGDKVDNVPGVPLVGPETALGWIQKYGSLENLLAHAEEIPGKRGENLRASKDSLALSRQLVTIDTSVPVTNDYDTFAVKSFNVPKLRHLFTELGFVRLLPQLGDTPAPAQPASVPQQQGGLFDAQPTSASVTAPQPLEQLDYTTAKTVPHEYILVDTLEKFNEFYLQLKNQKTFSIDTETTGLNPLRAQLVGISFCWQAHEAYYIPICGPLGSKCIDINLLREKLVPIFADPSVRKIGQNIKYDMHILACAGMPLSCIAFDTMVASYVLDASRMSHSMDSLARDFLHYSPIPISDLIGKGIKQMTFDNAHTEAACEYSAEDADVTFQLYEYFTKRFEHQPDLKHLFDEIEMPLVCVLHKMEANGVSLDTALLRKMSLQIESQLSELTARIHETAGEKFNIDSPKQLGDILFDKLGLASVRSGKVTRSTDADVLETLSGVHPIIDLISQYRQLSKLKNTYLDKLGVMINPRTNRLHASFNQNVTATGRLSSSDPNLQNIPIRTELGRKIRGAFIPASPDYCIMSADYSQIELRLLAHFSKDPALGTAFAKDQDIHKFVASQIFNIPIEEVTSQQRSACKAVNFGIIYGQSPFGLSRTIGIPQAQAKKFIEDYYARYGSIRMLMDNIIATAKRLGYAQTILNRRRRIYDLDSKNGAKRALAERMAVNTTMQGSAADLIKVAMLNIQRRIDRENLPIKMILQVHDELVFELPKDCAQFHSQWIRDEMINAIKLDVPLKVDVTIGPSWLE